MNEHDRWEEFIDFRPVEGNYQALLAEFKEYMRQTGKPNRGDMVARFKGWLWSKGYMTMPARQSKY
jgi:hypothetical protein